MLGCFILMIMTDGGIYNNEVYFVTTDKVLADYFSKLSRELWNKTPRINHFKQKHYRWMKLRIRDREVAKLINMLTNGKQRIPSFIMNEQDYNIIAEYLRIVSSTDGGVVFYQNKRNDGYMRTERHIIIGCKNPIIKEQLKKLFSRIDIQVRLVKEGLRISGRKNLQKFREKVSFIPDCKVTMKSPCWRYFSKNQVLNLMLESYA